MRKFLIGFGVVLVVLVAAAFVGPRFIPADSLKADIAEQVRAATGRDFIIDGDLSFTLLPTPGLSVSGVRVSNISGAQADDVLRLKSAQVAVALRPLIAGRIEIERVVLVEPVFELEQLADGRTNWTFTPRQSSARVGESAAGVDASSDAPPAASGAGPAIQLNDLVVRDGTIIYRSPDITERIEGVNASFAAASLRGPFRAEGDVVVRGQPVSLRTAIAELENDRAIPVSLAVNGGDAEFSFSGVLSGFPNDLRLSGQLEGRADDAAALISAISGSSALPGFAASAVSIKGDLSANRDTVALNNVSLGSKDISATGAGTVSLDEIPQVDLVVNIGQLDLDRLLAESQLTGRKSNETDNRVTKTRARESAGATATQPAKVFALPSTLNVTLESKVGAIGYRGGVIRQATLSAQLVDGELAISQLSAQLPGSADVSVFGFVTEQNGQPRFGGQGEATANDLRGLLSWLEIDASAVPLDRLRKLSLTAKLDGVSEKFNLTEINLAVDGARVRGGVAVALRERLGLGIGLTVDTLNIDAYLPAPVETASPADAGTANEGSARPAVVATARAASTTGSALLDRFDAVVQLKAGALTYKGKSLQGVNFDGTLAAGALELRDASINNIVGTAANVSGRVEGVSTSAPVVDLKLDINSADANRLLQMLDAEPSFAIGPGRLQGTVRGPTDAIDMDLALSALEAQITARGRVTPASTDPRFDVQLDLRHADAGVLFSRIGGDENTAAASRIPGALRVAAAIEGGLKKGQLSADIAIGDGSLAVEGKFSNIGSGQMSGGASMSASHPDLATAVRLFSPDYRPALASPGPLKFSGELAFDPTTVRIENLQGNAGPIAFESDVNVALDGVRPRVVGALKTSEIIVDWFLPRQNASNSAARARGVPSSAGRQPSRAAAIGSRWSDDPLDLSPLRKIDADIALAAPSISYIDLKVDKAKLALKLTDGVLDLSELSGRAYGGAFNMTGQVTDSKVPSLNYALTMDGANAAQFTKATGREGRGVMSVLELLFPVSSIKLTSGTLSTKLDVASRGRSERELVGALSGQGDVTFTDAVADGVDVCRISNQLGNLNGLEGFLGLAVSAQGGTTKITNYSGQFDIAKGIATLPPQKIEADCATVDVAGSVDLPRWLIDMQAKAQFPEHPKFPGILVEEKGRLDRPNIRFVNSNQVQEYILAKSAASILRKLSPPVEQQRTSAPQASTEGQPTPAPQPAEQVRDLLKELLKKR